MFVALFDHKSFYNIMILIAVTLKAHFLIFLFVNNKRKSSCDMGILYLTFVSAMLGLGTAGDQLTYHNGRKFSTKGRDNDFSSINCAANQTIRGAWWYRDCRTSNLNGVYRNGANNGTMVWGSIRPIKRTEMKIRPKDF